VKFAGQGEDAMQWKTARRISGWIVTAVGFVASCISIGQFLGLLPQQIVLPFDPIYL
jgi:hypothetical protein